MQRPTRLNKTQHLVSGRTHGVGRRVGTNRAGLHHTRARAPAPPGLHTRPNDCRCVRVNDISGIIARRKSHTVRRNRRSSQRLTGAARETSVQTSGMHSCLLALGNNPDTSGPFRNRISEIAAGGRDVCLLRSASKPDKVSVLAQKRAASWKMWPLPSR